MTRMIALLAVLGFFVAGLEAALAQMPQPAPFVSSLKPERRNPIIYDVDFAVVVTPPYKAKQLRVWLPIPPSDAGQEVSASKLDSFPMAVTSTIHQEPVNGNRFAYFEFAKPEGAQILRHRFQIKVWEQTWNLDPQRIETVKEWPVEFDKYRRGETQAVVVDDRFQKLLKDVVAERSNPLADLSRVITWVNANFIYDHNDASLKADAEHALTKRRGHCSDYHGFCASMGRAMGSPTRVVYGINPFPKNSPSHCKLEVYLPPYGWVLFDVSETQKMQAALAKNAELDDTTKKSLVTAAQNRMLKGFRDNTWYRQTQGTDYDLAPKASQRVPIVRTAWIEADGVAYPDPDPANREQRLFSWMTVTKFTPDRPTINPFTDLTTLESFRK